MPAEAELVCPSHGPVLTETLAHAKERYRAWSTPAPSPAPPPPCSTARLTAAPRRWPRPPPGLADEGFQVTAADLVYDAADVSGLVNGCDVVLFGAPTINRNAPEAIWHAVHAVDAINTKGRAAGAFGSFGWTGEAADMLQAQLAQLKFKTLEKPFKVCFRPTEADLAAVADYAGPWPP